jgi:hypothetical protein
MVLYDVASLWSRQRIQVSKIHNKETVLNINTEFTQAERRNIPVLN